MAKTYGELILEYQNYEYSNEHYELMKECYELDLMTRYIKAKEFMLENMDYINSQYSNFNESYFGESVSEDNLQLLIESAKSKGKGIIDRIVKGLKSLWEKIKKFFSKLFSKFKKSNSAIDNLKDKLSSIDPVVAGAIIAAGVGVAVNHDKIGKVVNDKIEAHKKSKADDEFFKTVNANSKQNFLAKAYGTFNDDGFQFANKQRGTVTTFLQKINNNKIIKYQNIINAVFDNSDIVVIATRAERRFISIDDIKKIYTKLIDNKSKLKSIRSNLKGITDTSLEKGIPIRVIYDGEYAKMEEIFNSASDNFDKIYSQINSINDIGIDENLTTLNEIYSELVMAIGNSMKVYGYIENMRSILFKVIEKEYQDYFNELKKQKKKPGYIENDGKYIKKIKDKDYSNDNSDEKNEESKELVTKGE